jgi:hypothetical protein
MGDPLECRNPKLRPHVDPLNASSLASFPPNPINMAMSGVRRRRAQSGFTFITLVLLLALATVSGLIVIASIEDDQVMRRVGRGSSEAREAAEGGLMEVLNDQRLSSMLPDPSTPSLSRDYVPSVGSVYNAASAHRRARTYTARLDLIRMTPMLESSHSVVQAVMYQVQVDAVSGDEFTSGVQAEVYKVASARGGVIQPRSHAR